MLARNSPHRLIEARSPSGGMAGILVNTTSNRYSPITTLNYYGSMTINNSDSISFPASARVPPHRAAEQARLQRPCSMSPRPAPVLPKSPSRSCRPNPDVPLWYVEEAFRESGSYMSWRPVTSGESCLSAAPLSCLANEYYKLLTYDPRSQHPQQHTR